tara:strand:- start:312 stop:905 length:594 start_codon:yes stop_codon:yes gene_type:complete
MKINKKALILKLLKIIPSSKNFDDAINSVFNQMKVDKALHQEIKLDLFPYGLKSLMNELNFLIDEKLKKKKPPYNFKKFRVNEKIIYFVMQRLRFFDSLVDKNFFFKQTVRPQLLINSNKILYKIADEIWFLSGDNSTDFNFYSKRLILMNIYVATFSFFVFDRSKGLKKTEEFLNKQIKLVLSFGKIKRKFSKLSF